MGKYALLKDEEVHVAPAPEDFKAEVLEVLTVQLGHRSSEARRMVDEAMRRQPGISSAEELFQEVYRVEKDGGGGADTPPPGRVRGSTDLRV
jgi:Holliday junction DNA helicase RuvA